MKVRGVHHVSINVADLDAARRFYVDVLGLTERKDRPDFGFPGAWLDAGGQQVHLIGGPTPASQGQHFALQVDDLSSTIDELRTVGITVTDAIPVASNLQAFLNDPSGNQIELHQVDAALK